MMTENSNHDLSVLLSLMRCRVDTHRTHDRLGTDTAHFNEAQHVQLNAWSRNV